MMIQKTVNTKAKVDLKASILVKELDIYYSKSYWLSHIVNLKP